MLSWDPIAPALKHKTKLYQNVKKSDKLVKKSKKKSKEDEKK